MAQREQVFPGQSPIFGGGRLLPSPSQFFLSGEDRLRIVCVNSKIGVVLKVQWRTARPDGTTVPNSETHTPTSDRTTYTDDYELGTGSLLNVTIFASAGDPLIGQTFVIAQLVRGEGAAAIVLGTILAGYVTTVQALGFPGSPIVSSVDGIGCVRQITGSGPGAGQQIYETVPPGARWELVTFYALLRCSAVVANRRPRLVFFDQTLTPYGVFPMTYDATASQVINFTWAQGAQAYTFAPFDAVAPLPQNISLPGQTILTTNTVGFQVADRYDPPLFCVREWLEVS